MTGLAVKKSGDDLLSRNFGMGRGDHLGYSRRNLVVTDREVHRSKIRSR